MAKKQSVVDSFRASSHQLGRQAKSKNEKKSLEWFRGRVGTAVRSKKTSRPKPGHIYVFAYDAKHKKTLPYWDKYPLVVCLGVQGGYMMGLNLHYIPPKSRQIYLERLLRHATTDTITNKTRLNLDWNKIKRLPFSKHMIKTYLANRVIGSLEEVKPSEWINIIYMPLQQFVGPNGKNISATRAYNDRNKR